ncbi:MAG: RNA methyltransferase [Bacillota bacterium]
MPRIKKIESRENKIIKRLQGLKSKRNRDKENRFIVEGLRFVNDIPDSHPVELYVCSETFSSSQAVSPYQERADVILVPDSVFQLLSDTETPQGILAVCEKKETRFSAFTFERDATAPAFFVVAEELQDPGNLGTLLRTADACGCSGIFLTDGCVDLYNPKVLRSTMGSLFHLPIITHCTTAEIHAFFTKNHIPMYATHLQGDCLIYDLPLFQPCGIVIGNEGRGISKECISLCDTLVKIPMIGQAESLNASIAAGVILYEGVRQRLSNAKK